MFYIFSFLFVFSLNASFDRIVKIVTEKPWLLNTLIKKGQVAALLSRDSSSNGGFNPQTDPFDYKIFNNELCVVKKHENKFSFCQFASLEKLPNPIFVPQCLEKIFLTSKDEFVYKNGSYLKVAGKEYAGIINIPLYADYDFQVVFLIKNYLYVLDDCGYVRCLKLFGGSYKKLPWYYFFLKEKDRLIKTQGFYEELPIRFFFEEGRWTRTRGVNLSISSDNQHLYLQTMNNQIVSAAPFGPMGCPWSFCYYEYPCQLLTADELYKYDFVVKKPIYKSTGGLKWDIVLGSPRDFMSDLYELIIRFSMRPLRQSILWITLFGLTLTLNKSRLFKAFSLFATFGALLVSNRKFLFELIEKNREKRTYLPIEEVFDM